MNRTFLAWCRTTHIYLTMFGLLVLLFFGITGFTINHEEWFGATTPRLTESQGQTPVELIRKNDQLRIVEHLRKTFSVRGEMMDYTDLDDKVSIAFKQPGQTWEVDIEKESGATHIKSEAFNFTAIINNLHRGRYSGQAWRWVIDISAILVVLACITGVVLWLALPKRRKLGIAFLVLGIAMTTAVYVWWVP